MPFIKSVNRSEIVHGMMSKRCRQTQFLSTAGFGNEMKLKIEAAANFSHLYLMSMASLFTAS